MKPSNGSKRHTERDDDLSLLKVDPRWDCLRGIRESKACWNEWASQSRSDKPPRLHFNHNNHFYPNLRSA